MKDGATQNLNPLQYEETFDRGRRTLHRDGDDFTLTLTPRPTLDTATSLLLIAAICIFCLAGAFWPSGKSTVYGMSIEHGGDTFTRVLTLGIGVLCALGLVDAFQHFRKQTTVESRRGVLTVAAPELLWGYKVRT